MGLLPEGVTILDVMSLFKSIDNYHQAISAQLASSATVESVLGAAGNSITSELQKGVSVGMRMEHINNWSILEKSAKGQAVMVLEKFNKWIAEQAKDWGGINPLQPVLLVGLASRVELELEDISTIAPDDDLFKKLRFDAVTLLVSELANIAKDDRGNPMFAEPDNWNIADFRQDCLSKAKEV